jgi:hypothetical protein
LPVSAGVFTADLGPHSVGFSSTCARYIRLRALSEVNGKPWTSAAEIDVIGTATQPTPSPPPGIETLFSDSFEDGTFSKWVQDSQNDWFNSTQRATEGSRSAEVDGRATDATLTMKDSINLVGKTSATLSFAWFIESSWDNGEYIRLDLFYSGTWHMTVYSINGASNTGPQENSWTDVNISLDSSTFTNDFKIRFRAKVSDSSEDGNVDNVKLVVS